MEQEVARTLGELERKLQELERVLRAMTQTGDTTVAGTTGASPTGASPPSTGTTGASPTGASPPSTGTTGASPTGASPTGASPTRTGASPTSTGTTSTGTAGASPTGASPTSASPTTSRIVDEKLERWQTPEYAAPAPAPRAPAPSHRQTFRSPPEPQPPGATELLRFRDRLEQTARELTREYDELLGRLSYTPMSTTTGISTISFARGAPSLDIVDVDGLREAAARAFDSDPAGTTAYGTSIGYPRLRSWIADRHGVEPDRVLVTNGSMQADAFLFEQLVREGEEVVVERPTYDRTLLSLRQRGARVHAVELEPDGINTEALAGLLGGGAQPTLAHIIPNFQNPAGYTLSYDKRRHLLELAAEHGFLVFEDDPYVELRFSGETLSTMLSMDPERVVYASSFSKTVCPGIRVGYLVGPPDLIAAVAQLATNTYISPNMVAQSIVYEFCASGAIERSIETVKAALEQRAQALAGALRSELADAEFVIPQGGYFMWVTLPEGTDVDALFHAAAERGVSFVKGTDFLMEGGGNTLRLAYSGVTPEQIDAGVARLAEAYRSL